MSLEQHAQKFAAKAHEGQVRKYTGDPYIIHPTRFHPGTKAPDIDAVYELKDGKFARYERGLWYRAFPTATLAAATQEKAGFMSPQFRVYENLKWRALNGQTTA